VFSALNRKCNDVYHIFVGKYLIANVMFIPTYNLFQINVMAMRYEIKWRFK